MVNWPPLTVVVAVVTFALKTTFPAWVLVTPVATVIGPPPIVYVPVELATVTAFGATPPAATVTAGVPIPLSSNTTLFVLANATAEVPLFQLAGPPTCQLPLTFPTQVRIGFPGLTVRTRLFPD